MLKKNRYCFMGSLVFSQAAWSCFKLLSVWVCMKLFTCIHLERFFPGSEPKDFPLAVKPFEMLSDIKLS